MLCLHTYKRQSLFQVAYLKLRRMIRAVSSVKRDKEYPTVYNILNLTNSCLNHNCNDKFTLF